MARVPRVPQSTGPRWFSLFGIKPQRSRPGQLSRAPLGLAKVREVVGLDRKPPEHARVLGG